MVRINLLPWREERRKQRQKEFQLIIAGAVAAALLLVGLIWGWFNGQIEGQHARNAFLEEEIKKVEAQIKDIEGLKQQREALLNRKQVIEELQANRYQMVHLFDAIMRTVPEGLILTALKQEGETLTLEGRAQSNARVATYMRNLENAGWMKNPDVTVIEASQGGTAAATGGATPATGGAAMLPYMFTMRVTLANPEEPRDPNAPPTPDPVVTQAPVESLPVVAPVAPVDPAQAPANPAPAAETAQPATEAAPPAANPQQVENGGQK